MSLSKLPPATRLSLVLAIGLLAAMAATLAALEAPWLGLRLAPPTKGAGVEIVSTAPGSPAAGLSGRLVAMGGAALEAQDLTPEPDLLPDYSRTDAFLQRQSMLRGLLDRSSLSLQVQGAAPTPVTAVSRPIATLPFEYWMQLAFGLGGLFVGGWIWSVRRADPAARVFALSGLSMLAFSTSAGVYSTRELAMDGGLFRLLSAINHAGAMGFGAAMITLFLIYPRIIAPRWALLALNAAFALWLAADLVRLVPNVSVGASGAVALQMALIVAAVIAQAIACRRDPVGGAALRWLGLSVVLGAGAFILTSVVPPLLGQPPLVDQGYAFGFFFLIYVAMALGLRRHRVFQLDEWAFRIAFYGVAAVAFAALDAGLVLLLQLSQAMSLAMALLVVGFLYLPLRDSLWRRLVSKGRLSDEDLVGGVVDAALAPASSMRAERWTHLLERLFDPVEIVPARDIIRAAIVADGLEMVLPASAASPPLRVRLPWKGRGLFNPSHLRLAERALALLDRVESGRQSYERGRNEERRRIARDLHDDVGAILLSSLHKDELGATRGLIRHAIDDIAAIVDELTGDARPLAEVLADLRYEAGQRLGDAAIVLDWPLEGPFSQGSLSHQSGKNLRSAMREIVSNVIRHSGATQVTVRLAVCDGRLQVDVRDDGRGLPQSLRAGGHGLHTLGERLTAVGGRLSYPSVETGVCIVLQLPLETDGLEAAA